MEWGWCGGGGGVHGFIIFFSKSILEYFIHFQPGSIECTLYTSHYTPRGRFWVILFVGTWLAIPLHFWVWKGELKVGNKLDWLPMFVVYYYGFLLCFWVLFNMLILWVAWWKQYIKFKQAPILWNLFYALHILLGFSINARFGCLEGSRRLVVGSNFGSLIELKCQLSHGSSPIGQALRVVYWSIRLKVFYRDWGPSTVIPICTLI